MIDTVHILDVVWRLRAAGFPVSPTQSMQCMRGCAPVGICWRFVTHPPTRTHGCMCARSGSHHVGVLHVEFCDIRNGEMKSTGWREPYSAIGTVIDGVLEIGLV